MTPRRRLALAAVAVTSVSCVVWLLAPGGSGGEADIGPVAPAARTAATGTVSGPRAERHGRRETRPTDIERSGRLGRDAPDQRGQLRASGRLLHEDRSPFPDLELMLGPRSDGGQPITSVRSGPDGRFVFVVDSDWQGALWIADEAWVLAGGKAAPLGPGELLSWLSGDMVRQGDGALHFGPAGRDIDFGDLVVGRAGSIAGVVAGRHRRPVAGAVLSISCRQGPGRRRESVESAADGTFRFVGLGSGDYSVEARAPGYFRGERRVELQRGEQRTGLWIELGEGRRILGRVVDDRGEAVAGALVSAYSKRSDVADPGASGVQAWDETDETGAFLVAMHEHGTLSIYAKKRGYETARLEDPRPEAAPFLLRMRRNGFLSGVAVDAAGAPLAGSWVWATRKGKSVSAITWDRGMPQLSPGRLGASRARTRKDGRFRIALVPSGEVAVHAVGPHPQIDRHGILVRPGEETTDVKLALPQSGRLDVLVQNPDGQPVAGAKVGVSRSRTGRKNPGSWNPSEGGPFARITAMVQNEQPLLAVRTDRDGHARLMGLPAALLLVRASDHRWVAGDATTVVLTEGGKASATLRLRRGGRVELRSVDPNGAPVGGQYFGIVDGQTRASRRGTTDARGHARIEHLRPGDYRAVLYRRSARGSFALMLSGTETIEAPAARFRVADGETVTVRLECPRLARVFGTVSRAARPLAGAEVTVLRQGATSAAIVGTCKTDGNGSYQVDDLEPGKHLLCISHDECVLAQRVGFLVAPGMDSLRQDIVVASGLLHLRVLDGESGQPVFGAVVTIRRPGAAPASAFVNFLGKGIGGHAESGPTNETGEVEVGLPPGRYHLRLRHPDHVETRLDDVVIRAGTRSTRTARVLSCARLTVRVKLPNGKSPRFCEVRYRPGDAGAARTVRSHLGEQELQGLGRGIWSLSARSLDTGSEPTWGPERRVELGAHGMKVVDLVSGPGPTTGHAERKR